MNDFEFADFGRILSRKMSFLSKTATFANQIMGDDHEGLDSIFIDRKERLL
jgi:hypothetical protein